MSNLERVIGLLPGASRSLAKGDGDAGIVWDKWTGHFARVRLGPKGNSVEERGVFVEGDVGPGNMPYGLDTKYYRVQPEVFLEMIEETLGRKLSDVEIEDILNGCAENE